MKTCKQLKLEICGLQNLISILMGKLARIDSVWNLQTAVAIALICLCKAIVDFYISISFSLILMIKSHNQILLAPGTYPDLINKINILAENLLTVDQLNIHKNRHGVIVGTMPVRNYVEFQWYDLLVASFLL